MKIRIALIVLTVFCAALLSAASIFDGSWAANGGQGAPQALVLTSSGSNLTGTADGVAITNGHYQMANLWFNLIRGGVSYSYKGTVNGNSMQLSESRSDGTGTARSITFAHQ